MINISLIKDVTMCNHISTTSPTYFKGISIPTEHIERPQVSIDIKIGENGAEPMTTTGENGDTSTLAPVPTSTLRPTKISILPPFQIATRIIRVPPEFLQQMVDLNKKVIEHLTQIETYLAMLFGQIRPQVKPFQRLLSLDLREGGWKLQRSIVESYMYAQTALRLK